MNVLAIDLGGTNLKLGIVRQGELLEQCTLEAHSEGNLADQLPHIENAFHAILEKHNLSLGECVGMGVSSTGLVDCKQNRILSTNKKFQDSTQLNLVQWAKETFGLPLRVENDAHAALLGEWFYGVGKGCQDLVMIVLGTGVGTSVIIREKPLRGRWGQAGLLGGHIRINIKGHPCTCPSFGCAEAESSTWALSQIIHENPRWRVSNWPDWNVPNFKDLFTLDHQGHQSAKEIVEHCVQHWTAVVISMIHLFAPEKVILGGGVMKSAEHIIPPIQHQVNHHAWISWDHIEIVSAMHLDTASLLGVSAIFERDIDYL